MAGAEEQAPDVQHGHRLAIGAVTWCGYRREQAGQHGEARQHADIQGVAHRVQGVSRRDV